jgi:DNA-binding transcriptional MerR regulator
VYAEKDIAVLKVIRKLLREERYTVAGAKEYLRLHGVQDDIEDNNLVTEETEANGGAIHHVAPTSGPQQAVIRELASEIRGIASDLRRKTSSK